MAVRHGSVWWVLILLVVGLVGVGAAAAVWWPLAGVFGFHQPATGPTTRTNATVVISVSCEGRGQHDTVEFRIGGKAQRAALDGCGHREGETFDVQVPGHPGGGRLTVQAADAAPVTGPSLERRLTVLLLSLSGVAGGGYAFVIRRRSSFLREAV